MISFNTSSNNDPNIIIFGGGSAQGDITSALIRLGARVTRIVSIGDDGGSSGSLRDAFGVVPVGDIRNALVSMAQAFNSPKKLISFLDGRFHEDITEEALWDELNDMISMDHPLMNGIHPDSQKSLSRFLTYFKKELDKFDWSKKRFKLANMSIGNLVLIGAYFGNSNNLNSAIDALKKLCNIRGSIWPTSLDGNIYLGAFLEDGSIILGEHNITKRDRIMDKRRIKKIFLTNKKDANKTGHNSVRAVANREVINAINKANIIIYGPGSFFTSILPHLLVDGIAESISGRNVPKILIGNICQDNETHEHKLVKLVNIFLNTAQDDYISQTKAKRFITHIMAHKPIRGFDPCPKKGEYLPLGDVTSLSKEFISTRIKDYENPEKKGYHDPVITAEEVIRIWKEEKVAIDRQLDN